MKLWSDAFRDGGLLPAANAFAVIDPASRVRLSQNRNPHLAWDDIPQGSEALALFCIDVDAPLDGGDVNREDRPLKIEAARGEFFHWSLIDLAPVAGSIGEGLGADGVTARGKNAPTLSVPGPGGADGASRTLRQGVNDYSIWFAGDAQMAGDYYGYDGPCPPWNDERIHHYIFRLYALDTARLPLARRFTGQQARAAMHGHILDEAQLVCAYSLNPALASTLKK